MKIHHAPVLPIDPTSTRMLAPQILVVQLNYLPHEISALSFLNRWHASQALRHSATELEARTHYYRNVSLDHNSFVKPEDLLKDVDTWHAAVIDVANLVKMAAGLTDRNLMLFYQTFGSFPETEEDAMLFYTNRLCHRDTRDFFSICPDSVVLEEQALAFAA